MVKNGYFNLPKCVILNSFVQHSPKIDLKNFENKIELKINQVLLLTNLNYKFYEGVW